MTKFLNISTDTTLGGNSPSDVTVSSQKALKTYIDAHASGSPSWGSITGTLSDQTDLKNALDGKQNSLTAGTGISISSGTISVTSPVVVNSATSTGAFSISGGNTEVYSYVLGSSGSTSYSSYGTAIGIYARVGYNSSWAIQLGYGQNNEGPSTFCVGLGPSLNYKLLGSDGIIPSDRISVMTGADGTNAGAKGLVPAPSATDNTKYLKGDGTWASVDALPNQSGQSGKFLTTNGSSASWANALQNTATGDHALTIDGYSTSRLNAINIGYASRASNAGVVALGYGAEAKGFETTAIGTGAVVTDSANYAIQLGAGTNSTATTLNVGFNNGLNYQLLDGTTGYIPYGRIEAVKDSNGDRGIKTWTGTKAQYDAILSKDANTLYNITDDVDVSLPILEALYPVGSIYITTANTCPLSTLISGSTWTLRDTGIVTSVNTNVPCKGNGTALGLTNTTSNFGFINAGDNVVRAMTKCYGTATGTYDTSSWTYSTASRSYGVTSDETKSGIVGTVTRSTLTVNIFERTA